MSWTVTRQIQWPDGRNIVEVSAGGSDYTNPDMLAPQYDGEGETYHDPRQAAEAAISICRAWRKEGTRNARVGYGATGGATMPFDACTFKELEQWAEERYQGLRETLAECDYCGDLIWDPKEAYTAAGLDGDRFCRQYHAELALQKLHEELADLEE
jgi:hypothetical protein